MEVTATNRPVGGATHHPKSAKRSTFSQKVDQKWDFCMSVKGVRFKKSTFWGPKGPYFGDPAPPQN